MLTRTFKYAEESYPGETMELNGDSRHFEQSSPAAESSSLVLYQGFSWFHRTLTTIEDRQKLPNLVKSYKRVAW